MHVKSGSFVHVRRLVVCARFCCVILSLSLLYGKKDDDVAVPVCA